MATLFFDGFDRATVLKKLDPNYWSTEFPRYPKYAFGGYTYSNTNISNDNSTYNFNNYSYYSINNGIIPSGHFYGSQNQGEGYRFLKGNYYPGFGSPPGFIALTNIPVNNIYNLEPISYLKLSGFPTISGDRSYFGVRCLGIETKHDDYLNQSYPAGRFGNKHPFLAFCSGNTTGLLLSIVKISGEHLQSLKVHDPTNNNNGPRLSIGLQVEQNNGISGIFDLNVSDAIANYRITPLYNNGDDASNQIYYPPIDANFKILTIATNSTNQNVNERPGGNYTTVISRWAHFEFEIDHAAGSIQLKLESTDALVENTDSLIDREDWDTKIYINNFKYDNIRFFNRTYHNNIVVFGNDGGVDPVRYQSYYYGLGSLILYDDITLIDSSGNEPRYFLGHDSKILPIHPGFSGSLNNNGNISDGLTQWNTNSSSYRRALASLDQDASIVYTDKANLINAIPYSNVTMNVDPYSEWRSQPNDAVAGLKVYNSARKNFLDTSFSNVVQTGIDDTYRNNVAVLIHAEENPVRDYSKYNQNIIHSNNTFLVNDHKFGNSGLSFNGMDSYLIVNSNKHVNRDFPITLECWIKFTGVNDNIILLDTSHKFIPYVDTSDIKISLEHYRISCTTGYLNIERWPIRDLSIIPGDDGSDINTQNLSCINPPASLILPLPSAAETGIWHHIALTKQINNYGTSGWYTVFLNGISGTTYQRKTMPISSSYQGLPLGIGWVYTYSCLTSQPDEYPVSGKLLFQIDEAEYDCPADSVDGTGIFNRLNSSYISQTNQIMQYPYMYIGYSGLIDEFRYTTGICRYTSNFIPRDIPFIANAEDYIAFGPVHNVDRSLYKTFQFYQMDNPRNNLPWTSGDIFRSGLILGVKKL